MSKTRYFYEANEGGLYYCDFLQNDKLMEWKKDTFIGNGHIREIGEKVLNEYNEKNGNKYTKEDIEKILNKAYS